MSDERWLLVECECCGAIGMADRVMAHNECSAVSEWHRWFDEHPDRPIDEENPVEIPQRLIEVEPVEERGPLQNATLDLVKPEPGQTVVVTLEKLSAPHILEAIGEQLERTFPDNRCVVMEDQLRVRVDELAAEFEGRSKYELRTTFGVPFEAIDKAEEKS